MAFTAFADIAEWATATLASAIRIHIGEIVQRVDISGAERGATQAILAIAEIPDTALDELAVRKSCMAFAADWHRAAIVAQGGDMSSSPPSATKWLWTRVTAGWPLT